MDGRHCVAHYGVRVPAVCRLAAANANEKHLAVRIHESLGMTSSDPKGFHQWSEVPAIAINTTSPDGLYYLVSVEPSRSAPSGHSIALMEKPNFSDIVREPMHNPQKS
jgi:hypothetical protein